MNVYQKYGKEILLENIFEKLWRKRLILKKEIHLGFILYY
jgi:hypothetical protein